MPDFRSLFNKKHPAQILEGTLLIRISGVTVVHSTSQ